MYIALGEVLFLDIPRKNMIGGKEM